MKNPLSLDQLENSVSGEYARQWEGQSNGRRIEQAKALAVRIVEEQLTDRQRQMVVLYFQQGLKMCEIARQLEVHPSTVSRTLRRGINRLRDRMRYYNLRE